MADRRYRNVLNSAGLLWAVAVAMTSAGLLAFWYTGSAKPHVISLFVALLVVVLTPVNFLLYGWDKLQARWSKRRIPERMLLAIDFCGGWPGGMAARRLFRHKTIKLSYRTWFAIAVLAHSVIATTIVVLSWTPPAP